MRLRIYVLAIPMLVLLACSPWLTTRTTGLGVLVLYGLIALSRK